MLMHEFIRGVAEKTPGKDAVVCGNRSTTFRQLVDDSGSLAQALLAAGIGKGDRVGLLLRNGLDIARYYYACFQMGAIAVPINIRDKAPEVAYALNQSGSRILVTSREFAAGLDDISAAATGLESVTVLEDDGHDSHIIAAREAADSAFAGGLPAVSPADPAVIFYTSGSTGKPKGVVHTHESLYYAITNKSKTLELTSDEVGLAGTQVSHIAGFSAVLTPALANGGTCVVLKQFDAGAYIEHLRKYRPTLLVLLPNQLLEVLEHPDSAQADFSRARHMLIAGDKVPHHVYELFRDQAGFDLTEGCGMTECEGYCVQPPHEPVKPGSIGKPIAGVEIRIVDSSGAEVPDGETGEFRIKADSLMASYWNNPEANERAFADGWFKTGDLGYRDDDGYYHFVGRIKEIIIRGGSNIMPAEVEDVLDDHPKVMLSGVVGFPDDHLGNIVGAFIMPEDEDGKPTPGELAAFAARSLADYKVPERWIFVDAIPKNPTGKLDRHRLHEMARQYAGIDHNS